MAVDNIDSLIHQLGGCGRFQVLMSLACYAADLPSPFVMLMMVFGRYNPGMECSGTFHNLSLTNSHEDLISSGSTSRDEGDAGGSEINVTGMPVSYDTGTLQVNITEVELTCDNVQSCAGDIKFDDSAVTIVTEWNLICDRAWISSLIISVQMAGVLVGSFCGGVLANRYGRKRVIYTGIALNGVFNFIAAFSVSWHMFAALRFFMGLSLGTTILIPFYLQGEFMPVWWRGFMGNLPDWNLATLLFIGMIFVVGDWRHVLMVTGILCFLVCLPALWVPESLRWLAVQGKYDRTKEVLWKVAATNRKTLIDSSAFQNLQSLSENKEKTNNVFHGLLTLFRRDLRKTTLILGWIWFACGIVASSVFFGVTALSGNFYINLMLFSLLPLPLRLISQFTVNILGRRWTSLGFAALAGAMALSVVIVQNVLNREDAGIPTTVLVIACAKLTDTAWQITQIWAVELYPTTIRSLGITWIMITSKIGGVIAPFLIPSKTVPLTVTFTIISVLLFTVPGSCYMLTETKEKPLKDVISEDKIDECLPECENEPNMICSIPHAVSA